MCAPRKESAEESTASLAGLASDGVASCRRPANPCGAPHGAVAPLRPRVKETAGPLPRMRCRLSPWSVVLLLHLTLPGCGAGLLSPWGGVLLRAVVRRSCQSHADGLLFVSPPRTQPPLPLWVRSLDSAMVVVVVVVLTPC